MEPFLTSDGREIPLKAVGLRYVQMIMDKHKIPPEPTYEVTTAAGVVEVHKRVVKDDAEGKLVGTTLQGEEDWAMWRQYQADRVQATSDRMEAAVHFLMCQCVALDPPPLDDWGMDFAYWELEPPDPADAKAFKVYWIENELLPEPDDLARLLSRLYVIGGIVGEDQAQNLERFFRLTVARLGAGGAGGAPAGETAGAGAGRRQRHLGAGAGGVGAEGVAA